MSDDVIAHIQTRAAEMRRLAASTSDRQARLVLLMMADGAEAHARDLQAEGDPDPTSDRSFVDLAEIEDLAAVNLEGAGDVEVYGVHGETFLAATEGSGAVKATGLDVGQVQLATGGAGCISVEGRARKLRSKL